MALPWPARDPSPHNPPPHRFKQIRDDKAKLHPMLIPYSELTDTEKAYDLDLAIETLKVLQVRFARAVQRSCAVACKCFSTARAAER